MNNSSATFNQIIEVNNSYKNLSEEDKLISDKHNQNV